MPMQLSEKENHDGEGVTGDELFLEAPSPHSMDGGIEEQDSLAQPWLQCDLCDKWRKVTVEEEAMYAEGAAWDCSLNLDDTHNSCQEPQVREPTSVCKVGKAERAGWKGPGLSALTSGTEVRDLGSGWLPPLIIHSLLSGGER